MKCTADEESDDEHDVGPIEEFVESASEGTEGEQREEGEGTVGLH